MEKADIQLIGKKIKDKPIFQTLYGHSEDSATILKRYVDENFMVIDDFCKHHEIETKHFLKNLFITVYLHDVGKGTIHFQKNILHGKHSQYYPHAFYGFSYFKQLIKSGMMESIFNEKIPVETLAVLGHHTQLYKNIYEDINNDPIFDTVKIKRFISTIDDVYKKLSFDKYFKLEKFNGEKQMDEIAKNAMLIVREIKNIIGKDTAILDSNNKIQLKTIFTYFFSILQLCDDYSSANFSDFVDASNSLGQKIEIEINGKPEIITVYDAVMNEADAIKYIPKIQIKTNEIIKKIIGDYTPYPFQTKLFEKISGYTLLFAPCGRGKTEGALIWALRALEKYNKNKIIFAMPTQITSNAMYDRMKKIFNIRGIDNVGIFHGKSIVKLKENINFEETYPEFKQYAVIKSEDFKGNIFFKPITVTTIDHLILSFVHGFSQADFSLGNIINSVVIFDEVHYYETKTLEHLITLFSLMREMIIPHLLMSGTLPDFLINKVNQKGEYDLIKDDEGLEFKPFKVEIHEETLINNLIPSETVLDKIIDLYKSNKRIFVLCNTVRRAQKIYTTLSNRIDNKEHVLLYHSQFTYEDRAQKEKKIIEKKEVRPFILVSTQTIEISLDISCDAMFSEIAPPDALGQRAGRLNRGRKSFKDNGEEFIMHIYKTEEIDDEKNKPRPYDVKLLKLTLQTLNTNNYNATIFDYNKIKNICDDVYKKYEYDLIVPSNFIDIFKENSLFGDSPRVIAFSEEEANKLQIRSDEYRKITVVPYIKFNDNEKNLTVENSVKIPLWLYMKDIKEHGDDLKFFKLHSLPNGRYYIICKIPYNSDYGFDYDKYELGEVETEDFII